MTIYAIVYYASPNVEVRHFRWITPGAVVGVLLWIIASALFFVYVSNFSSYSATYGAFAGAVILLVWLWVTNLALLFGAELNAVVDLRRAKYLPESVRRAGAPGQGAGGGLSVTLCGWLQSASRPGQSPHSSRCGVSRDRIVVRRGCRGRAL